MKIGFFDNHSGQPVIYIDYVTPETSVIRK